MSKTIPLPPREQVYNRYCSKLEYIENSHVGLEDMAQVRNLVGTSHIISKLDKLDLQAISNMLPNSKLEEQKFAVIKILLGQPVCTVLLFTCCKMVLTGSKSMLDCILASTSVFHHILQGFQGFDFQLEPVKSRTSWATLRSASSLTRSRLAEILPGPQHFLHVPAQHVSRAHLQTVRHDNCSCTVLLIFFSSKLVITGAKSMVDVYNGWVSLAGFLKAPYKVGV